MNSTYLISLTMMRLFIFVILLSFDKLYIVCMYTFTIFEYRHKSIGLKL